MFVEEVWLFFGGADRIVCGNGPMCVRCICVFVVEATNEPPEFGGISVVCDGVDKLFPFDLLFVLDIITYFFVLRVDAAGEKMGLKS